MKNKSTNKQQKVSVLDALGFIFRVIAYAFKVWFTFISVAFTLLYVVGSYVIDLVSNREDLETATNKEAALRAIDRKNKRRQKSLEFVVSQVQSLVPSALKTVSD